ncbi:uncharacterized protein LOC126995348 [Eriocheir sinensis]|uniref:uncharacterized protein LOC126995348 n=1 Tax=Eriocheir sinensis TaxID=95602 RepID=UPI0021C8B5FF|nr:uncharacterized protein LOC126995348 [Eriocheir sinensis]
MELFDQETEIVDGVTVKLYETFGSDAEELISRKDIVDKAQIQLLKGCNVQEAIEQIFSSLQWIIRRELDKLNSVKKIRDDLERTSEKLIVKKIQENLEKEAGCFQEKGPHTAEEEAHASSQPELSSVGEASNSVVSRTSASTTLEDSNLHDDHKDISSDDDDVLIVSPAPKEPAPLILLTDDSCESTSSVTNNGCESIINLTKSQKGGAKPSIYAKDFSFVLELLKDVAAQKQMPKRKAEIALDYADDSLANLHKDERTLNERINEIKSEEKRCIDNIDNMSASSSSTGTEDDDSASHSPPSSLSASLLSQLQNSPPAEASGSHLPPSPLSASIHSQLQNSPPAETKSNACTDENKNNAIKIHVLSLPTSNQPEGSQSAELWEDAHFVCSLLPYFTLKDVHQTMVDNLHHPDRRAYVLEAYINLAVDRQEPVQDDVFQGLWAVRKRSHGEVADSHVKGNIKKRKIELEPEADVKGLRNDEGIPSTSNAGSTPLRGNEPGMSTDVNTDISDAKVKDPVMEKWYEEKMNLVCAVVQGVDRNLLWTQILSCQTDADIEALVERLMEEQDQAAIHSTITAAPYQGQDQPSTSAFQPVAAAGPSHASERRDEPVPGQSSEEAATGEEDQGGQAADLEEKILAQVKTLSEMFADADPDYLQERCVDNNGDEAKFQEVVDSLLQKKDYPKIEEYHKRQKRLEIKKKFIEGMSVEEFLEYFEDPEKVFSDTSTNMSPTYIENARTQLKRDLPFHLIRDIDSTFKSNNHHYLPTLRALQENTKLTHRKTKRTSNLKERDLDDIFIKELCYARMEAEIKNHLFKKEEYKRWSFLQAKAKNQLKECRCCYTDELLEEDMEPCKSEIDLSHKFCVNYCLL